MQFSAFTTEGNISISVQTYHLNPIYVSIGHRLDDVWICMYITVRIPPVSLTPPRACHIGLALPQHALKRTSNHEDDRLSASQVLVRLACTPPASSPILPLKHFPEIVQVAYASVMPACRAEPSARAKARSFHVRNVTVGSGVASYLAKAASSTGQLTSAQSLFKQE